MDTKFCPLCDEYYDWSAPECPFCAARNSAHKQSVKMANLKQEFIDYLNMVQTTLAHLLQDGDVTTTGIDAVTNLLCVTEQFQDKHTDDIEQCIKNKNEKVLKKYNL